MRAAAEEFLKDFPNFKSIDGTAENTTLDGRFGRYCYGGAGVSLVRCGKNACGIQPHFTRKRLCCFDLE